MSPAAPQAPMKALSTTPTWVRDILGAGGVGRGGMGGKNQEHWGSGELGGRMSRVAAPSLRVPPGHQGHKPRAWVWLLDQNKSLL